MAIFDISQLTEHNPWWIDRYNIYKDKKLSDLDKIKHKWHPNIKHRIDMEKDVILTLRGPRQVGKTTLMKVIIKDLLIAKQLKPENIFFWSFENNNLEEMIQIINTYLEWRTGGNEQRKYLFLDEICAVKNWNKGLISLSNKGLFDNCSILVTGSHSMDIKHSTELMPGRRGGDEEGTLDKILLPMKFSEFVKLLLPNFKQKMFDYKIISAKDRQNKIFDLFNGKIPKDIENLMPYKKQLDSLLETYLLTGGIPSTINEYKENEKISTRLFNVYLTSIIGDLNRYGYKEIFFKQIIREVFKVLSNPVSWNSFTKNTSVKSHNTVQDYITAMEELYIANISFRCSLHDKKIHYFMKKLYILDPFIFHALHGWSNGKKDYFKNAKTNVLNLEMKSKIVESVVYNHLCRLAYGLNPRDLFDPKDQICYYEDNNKKEVDFVILFDDNYYPFEVKYQASIKNSDFFPFKSFGKGILITKDQLGTYNRYVSIPASLFLLLV